MFTSRGPDSSEPGIAVLPPNSPQRAAAEALLQSEHGQLRSLGQRMEATMGQLTKAGSGGSIVTLATPPRQPGSPSTLLALPVGLAAGLFLGLMAAFLLSRRHVRTYGATDA